jgi:hypothetical protein
MARWFVNPKRRKKTRGGGRVRRPRVRVSGRRFLLGSRSPFKGKVRFVNPIIRNPFIREVGMYGLNPRRRRRYRGNPSIIRNPNGTGAPTLQGVMRNPLGVVSTGFTAMGAAYLTNSIPNMFALFPGTDLVSKLLRGVVRVVVGGFVYGAVKAIAPRQANAAAAGAAVGSIGATVLDLLNTRLILGYGDVVQTPGMLFAGVGNIFGGATTGTAGYRGVGAYTRPMGRLGAYTRPMGGYAGIYGSGSMAMMGTGSSIYG